MQFTDFACNYNVQGMKAPIATREYWDIVSAFIGLPSYVGPVWSWKGSVCSFALTHLIATPRRQANLVRFLVSVSK